MPRRDRLSLWAGRFDPQLRRYSLGHLNLEHLVRWAIDQGLAEVDLLIGDNEYKQRWATGSYDTLAVVAAAPGRLPLARVILGSRAWTHHLRQRVIRLSYGSPQARA